MEAKIAGFRRSLAAMLLAGPRAELRNTFKVLGISAVVVLAGCLIVPDAAFARGGGGGGFHGGGRGGHSGYGGYGHGHSGFYGSGRYTGAFGHHSYAWGTRPYWHNWNQNWGAWGGWARPWHWSNWYLGSGWGMPTYLGGAALSTAPYVYGADAGRLNADEVMSQLSDEDGILPPPRHYRYQPDYVNVYSNAVSPPVQVPLQPPKEEAAAFQLGPDADIIGGGRVAIYLTDSTYLLLTPKGTQVMDQETGMPILSLHTDPFLIWQIQSEIKRQSLLIQLALQSQQSESVVPQSTSLYDHKQDDDNRSQKMQAAIDLLNQTATSLGELPQGPPPPASQPPVPKATEILSSVWLCPHGKYIVVKLQDDSLAYMDGTKLYSDEGKTKLAMPYPAKFRSAVMAYLDSLVKDASKTSEGLVQAKEDAENQIFSLQQKLELQSLQSASTAIQSADSLAVSATPETRKHLQQDLDRTKKHLEFIKTQLEKMPEEVSAAKKLLAEWQVISLGR